MKTLILLSAMTISGLSFAQDGLQTEVDTSAINPAYTQTRGNPLQDGLETTITTADLNDLGVWAQNTKKDLDLLNTRIQHSESIRDQLQNYEAEIDKIVAASESFKDLTMRKTLNRASALGSFLEESRRTRKFLVAMYNHMVNRAKDNFQSDIQFIENKSRDEGEFIQAEFNSLKYLMRIAKSGDTRIRSEEKRLAIARTYFGYINVDLFNSPYRNAVGFEIRNIQETLKKTNFTEGDEAIVMGLFEDAMAKVRANVRRTYSDSDTYTTGTLTFHNRDGRSERTYRDSYGRLNTDTHYWSESQGRWIRK